MVGMGVDAHSMCVRVCNMWIFNQNEASINISKRKEQKKSRKKGDLSSPLFFLFSFLPSYFIWSIPAFVANIRLQLPS